MYIFSSSNYWSLTDQEYSVYYIFNQFIATVDLKQEDDTTIGGWKLSTIVVAVVCVLVLIALIVAVVHTCMKKKRAQTNDHEMK